MWRAAGETIEKHRKTSDNTEHARSVRANTWFPTSAHDHPTISKYVCLEIILYCMENTYLEKNYQKKSTPKNPRNVL